MTKRMAGKRYSTDFKDSMIKLYHEGNSFTELSVQYGVSADSIRHWVRQATPVTKDETGKLITDKEFKKLQKELAIAKEELEILKRAAILLAKH
ncbi:transposase [Weissella oryzae]|nr:transposase [Weissella oryzae]